MDGSGMKRQEEQMNDVMCTSLGNRACPLAPAREKSDIILSPPRSSILPFENA